MQSVLEQLRQIGGAIVDPWVVVDLQQNIVEFNGAFFALFPRQVARRLKKMKCCEALRLDNCAQRCLAQEAIERGQGVRYDEMTGTVAESEEPLRLIGSATPLFDAQGQVSAALLICRNVTDEAKIQAKYKSMLEDATRERQALLERLSARTAELLAANETVRRLEDALLQYRKGLWESPCLELPPGIPTAPVGGWDGAFLPFDAPGSAGCGVVEPPASPAAAEAGDPPQPAVEDGPAPGTPAPRSAGSALAAAEGQDDELDLLIEEIDPQDLPERARPALPAPAPLPASTVGEPPPPPLGSSSGHRLGRGVAALKRAVQDAVGRRSTTAEPAEEGEPGTALPALLGPEPADGVAPRPITGLVVGRRQP